MIDFLVVTVLSCSPPIFENQTKFPWNENDQWNFDTALPKCKKLYTKSPCIKKFIKLGERDYRVICSKEI